MIVMFVIIIYLRQIQKIYEFFMIDVWLIFIWIDMKDLYFYDL